MLPENYQFVTRAPVIPVMVIEHIEDAVPMAQALVSGGLTTLEITLRTACGVDAIREIAKALPDAAVGAGTVTNAAQYRAVVDAGATFVVSPGCSDSLIKAAQDTGVPLLPGAVTATEVMAVQEAGLPIAKFFPAGTSGGAPAIKALGGPFADMKFIPTGGVSLNNLADYLRLKNIVAVGGSWVTPANACRNGDWETVSRLAREAVELAASIKLSIKE